jgi:anaerobic magnesium-protoporphyrin IX monomethyl ester cyclase
MAVKILFINAINPQAEIQSRWPNLGLGYLAASVRGHFGDSAVKIQIVDRNVKETLDNFHPDLVGITAVSQNYGFAMQHAETAKKMGIPVIIGGIHISVLPQTMTQYMDVAVIGEGEQTIVDVVKTWMHNCGFYQEQLREIPGIAFRDETFKLHLTPCREPISHMDSIPFPARDLLKIRSHTNIFSSRGCPYKCIFCASTRYWDKLRMFSAEYVVTEIRELVSWYGVRKISFYDDLMMADLNRLQRMVDLIRRYPSLSKIKFCVNARANVITDASARLLAEMGVVSAGMGLESGNGRTLRYLKGGSVSILDNYEAVRILHKYGIAANASFVIGSPDETKEEILDTYDFICKSGLDFVDTFVLVPFPGTPIWDYAKGLGLVSEHMDWNRLNVYYHEKADPIIVSQRVTKQEMDELYRKFKRKRYSLAARKAWFHPNLRDMFRAGIGKALRMAT